MQILTTSQNILFGRQLTNNKRLGTLLYREKKATLDRQAVLNQRYGIEAQIDAGLIQPSLQTLIEIEQLRLAEMRAIRRLKRIRTNLALKTGVDDLSSKPHNRVDKAGDAFSVKTQNKLRYSTNVRHHFQQLLLEQESARALRLPLALRKPLNRLGRQIQNLFSKKEVKV